jgi:hypothetical protein
MADLNGVKLVDAGRFDGRELTTTLARAEIERALDSGENVELVLDVARAAGPDCEIEAHSLAVALDRNDLEELLAADEGDEVGLQFDAQELEAILADDAEVEAHGLREKVAVLAVVATGAGALAGHAAARPTTDGGAGGKASAAATGMTAEQIWATAPEAVKRAYAKQDAERAARLQTPAPFHPSSGGGGFDISAPSPAEAALAGEVALLIAAAGLGFRGRQRRPVKPA